MTDRNTQLRQSGDRALRLVQRPHVGARWTPQHIVRQDSASGFYEELNAPSSRLSADAANLQTALLAPYRGGGGPAWRFVRAVLVLGLFAFIGVLLAWRA